jgi:uncharacterized protein
MSKLRLVLDSNVLVSAALFKRSIARQAFNKALSGGQVIMSQPVVAEIQDVFSRPRFDNSSRFSIRVSLNNNPRLLDRTPKFWLELSSLIYTWKKAIAFWVG